MIDFDIRRKTQKSPEGKQASRFPFGAVIFL